MLDYSIGHEIQLQNSRNDLLFDGFDKLSKFRQRKSIVDAVLICSRNWSDSFRPHKWMRLWSWLNRNADFALAIADFRNYRTQGTIFPPAPTERVDRIKNGDDDKGRSLGSPLLARMIQYLATMNGREFILNQDCVFDVPLGFATFLYSSHLETEGAMKIENQAEMETRIELEEIENQIKKEKEAASQA